MSPLVSYWNERVLMGASRMQSAIKALRAHRANLEGHVADLSSIMSELSVRPIHSAHIHLTHVRPQKTYNPNNQDMAVLGASRAFTDWQLSNGIATTGEVHETDSSAAPADPVEVDDGEEKVKEYSDRELQALEDEDALSLIDSINSRVGSPAGSITSSTSLALAPCPDTDIGRSLQYRAVPSGRLET